MHLSVAALMEALVCVLADLEICCRWSSLCSPPYLRLCRSWKHMYVPACALNLHAFVLATWNVCMTTTNMPLMCHIVKHVVQELVI